MGRFEQLAAFVEVVDQHGFSAAGQKLGVVKSVLSRRVSELEARLGVKLLNRTTRKLSLTGAGEQLYQQASVLLPELVEAEQKVSEEQLLLTGGLKIAAPLSFGYRHLSSVISEFILEHPEIDVSLELNDREIDLVAEGYDLALRIGELNDSTLIARKLCQMRFVSVTSETYLSKYGEPKHPSELVNHEGLFYSNVSDRHQWQFLDEGEVLTVVPRQRLRANNGDFLVNAAMQGLGIFQSPTFLCDDYRREGKLRTILQGYQRTGLGMYALYPPGRLIPRRVRLLVDFLHTKFGDLPSWDKDLL